MADDALKSLETKNLPEIKKFLAERGIKTSGYRKQELLNLAKEALNQNVPVKNENNEFQAGKKRRTVNGITYPHPLTIDTWNDSLADMPEIEAYDVQYYLKNNCLWTDTRLKSYKNDNSYRLHTNGHVSCVSMTCLPNNLYYLKGQCTPEERQSAEPYKMWVLVNKDGTIISGECACVA